jgi:hypothetical protein
MSDVKYDPNTQMYSKELNYQGIHLIVRYLKDEEGLYSLDSVCTPDGQNITDLVRMATLIALEGLIQ